MPELLDKHGNYGAVVRFTNSEWDAIEKLLDWEDSNEHQQ